MYYIVKIDGFLIIPWNGRCYDRYSDPKEFETIDQAAKEIKRKRMIYAGMSSYISIRKK